MDHVESGYYFTCDDDLIYPESFTAIIISALEVRAGHAVAGFHGWDAKPEQKSYHRDRAKNYHCLFDQEGPRLCHIIGTGCTGWKVGALRIDISDFPRKNMADLWFSRLCNAQQIPRIVLPHKADYLKYTVPRAGTTIWDENSRDLSKEQFQTDLLNATKWRRGEIFGRAVA